MKKKLLFLFLIVVLASFLRFWKLDQLPPSLYWDEVSQAYNAYSIWETGKDEHQEFLPIARFQAFGDYKAPINIYLTALSIGIFGKTDFAIRFPSAFLGVLTVTSVYFLCILLFINHPKKEYIGLAASFFMAISPWHVQLSRAAFEGNIATFFTILAVTLFYYSIRKKSWVLILSSISFVLAFYSFNAHRVFIPLLVFIVTIVEVKELLKIKKIVCFSFITGTFLLIPFLIFFRTPESTLRFQEVNIFTELDVVKRANDLIAQDGNSVLSNIIHNRRVLYAREYIINYFDFFNPKYLFFTGDVNPRFSHQENGQLFLWMLPFLIVGTYSLLIRRTKEICIIFLWFLLAPIAAATARETPHALRSATFIPTYEIIAAFGVINLFSNVQKYKKSMHLFILGLFIMITFSLIRFWHSYSVHNPILYSQDWQYGYKQAISIVKDVEHNYDRIYFTDTYGRAYIYVTWYGDILPKDFWKDAVIKKDTYGFYTVPKMGKYVFTDNFQNDNGKNVLYVTTEDKIPSDSRILKRVSFLDGKTAFVIVDKNYEE